ncbi:MAG: efflux RND transporter periplasmic adaptor subunit [Thalassolituus sp.]|jgi:HlyD family secretion protein|uniref:HlyD family secretion protein n=1 Tax=Thalassolituus TaxID=187492 RepID=UPI000BD97D28|nr:MULTISPECIES: efflux RND transporter periplasmic adaptor subunit [Thalassolituus]PCI49836.1 MAG: efflux transporter periplasmic adaptor subunit [Oceanospirillales bacterium]|tara:strand:- start:5438 stop:6409 length:972 start_codon:yes stop_codon:yes gene_type:complete
MKIIVRLLLLIATVSIATLVWWQLTPDGLPSDIISTNGRLEANQVEIASKTAGRIKNVLVQEGQMVQAGDLLVVMDNQQLLAQKLEAEAMVNQAELAAEEANAGIALRQIQLTLATSELARAKTMYEKHVIAQDKFEQAQNQYDSAKAALRLANATEQRSLASIDAARANLQQLNSILEDTQIKAPMAGRVQYKLVQPGEVISAGGRVITLLDVSDVYMTVFLPAKDIGKLSINDEARLILDAIPQYVIPTRISFIADGAQFTPKSVETADERDSLMFRIKLSIDPDLLKKNEDKVKTGVRGQAFVRTNIAQEWPQNLTINLP